MQHCVRREELNNWYNYEILLIAWHDKKMFLLQTQDKLFWYLSVPLVATMVTNSKIKFLGILYVQKCITSTDYIII